ncbi:hypothetical protein GGR54DRAFT_374663 [Hypoxylon sp. NC1633]|nr:hypothetical protein GGR54DRAFT_374663 [Hypoxylon sp. NC1633]
MVVRKPFYGIAEAGTHWWATYFNHHKDKLGMVTSTYDPCLLVSSTNEFAVVGLQPDDTIGLTNETFNAMEEDELQKAGFMAKGKMFLGPQTPLKKECERAHASQGKAP